MELGDSMEKTAAFHTLGCKVNQYETEALKQLFEKEGYRIVSFNSKADVYVINTCTVTGTSARKSRQMIRRARKNNPDAVVAAVGCYPQTAPEEAGNIQGADLVVGTVNRNMLPEYISSLVKGERTIKVEDVSKKYDYPEMGIGTFRERTRAYVKIQDGCSRFCSYCIIPYARGPSRSRRPESISGEIQRLAAEGYREIVLTGIHIASYGKDLGNTGLLDIIKIAHGTNGIERIRLGSLEPGLLTGSFIYEASSFPKLCPHFHVSLQSGCDNTLKRMNRKYTAREYEDAINKLTERFVDAAVTTDIMTGFPGETDSEFAITLKFLERLPLAGMHVFKFSARRGTPAYSIDNQVPARIKDERSRILKELSGRKKLDYYRRFEGRKMEVLYEQPVRTKPGYIEGTTVNYIRVASKGSRRLVGRIQQTLLQSAEEQFVSGSIV